MHAVRAPDHRRAAMLLGADAGSTSRSRSMSASDEIARLAHLQRQRRVDDVGRGQAEVQPARARADVLGDVGGEGDQVVLRHLLDLVDADRRRRRRARGCPSPPPPARCRPAAIASAAAVSTCSQVSKRRVSLQMRPMSGWVYRGITRGPADGGRQIQFAGRRPEHRRTERSVREQIPGDPLHVVGRHPLDAFERFVEREVMVEVDVLPGEVRHAAGGALQAEHEAALQVILRPPQLGVAERRAPSSRASRRPPDRRPRRPFRRRSRRRRSACRRRGRR